MTIVIKTEFNVADSKGRMMGVCVVLDDVIGEQCYKAFVRDTKDGKPFGNNYKTAYFDTEQEREEWVKEQVAVRQNKAVK